MNTALLGHTGFVGSELKNQYTFTDVFDSKNIGDIKGKSYDLVVCAAAPGVKWKANKFPEEDRQSIQYLVDHLKTINVKQFILISTIDVYPTPVAVNEDSLIITDTLHPYGKHRRQLELFVQQTFPQYTIVRLPALFGNGLKKNFIFDIIHKKSDQFPSPSSIFQFYPTANLWNDICIATSNKLQLINIATEPISAKEIAPDYALPDTPAITHIQYDMHTKYASLFQRQGFYLYPKPYILKRIHKFIMNQTITV